MGRLVNEYVLGVVCDTCGAKRSERCVTRDRNFNVPWLSVRIARAMGARVTTPHRARLLRAMRRWKREVVRAEQWSDYVADRSA